MVKAPSHGQKQPPPAPLIVQGRAVSATSVRTSSGGGSGRSTTTTNNKKPAGGNRPRPPSAQQQARRHPSSIQRPPASGRGRPRLNQNGVSSRSNGTGKSSSADSSGAPPPTLTRQQQQPRPQRKAPPTQLLTNARTSIRTSIRTQLQSVNENESSAGGNTYIDSNTNNDGFEALTWNPFQGEDGATTHNYWSGGSTQADLASTRSSVTSVENNQSRQISVVTIPTNSSTSGASSVNSSAYSFEGGVHISGVGGGSNKNKLMGTGKTTRKLAGKLASLGAKARGLTQMGDDAFYGAGEASFSTNIRTITEEEASGAAAAAAPISSSLTSSIASERSTSTQRDPPANNSAPLQRPSYQSLDSDGQTTANRGFIPTAFARLASVQSLSGTGSIAVATAQAIPVAGSTPTAAVVATIATLRPPAPIVVGGKVVVKGVAINGTFTGDLKKIETTVQKYKRIRASASSRQGSRAAPQSNSELAASIAELRACLPKLEALVNRAMLSRAADANALEKLLSLNDELRLILANLKGESIKRHINTQDGPTARSSQLPTTQQAREQHLFQKMRDDSNEIIGPVIEARVARERASANQEPLFHDDPFHDSGFPEFNNFDDDFETKADDAKSVRAAAKGSDEEDRSDLSRLEDEVARLEKQLSGLDPLAQLAVDTNLGEEMLHMSNLSITSDGDVTGFADMEREMMKRLAMGNAWMANEAVDDTPKESQVKFSQEVTVFEIPDRHQAREAER